LTKNIGGLGRKAAANASRHGRKAALGAAGIGIVALAYAGCGGDDKPTPPAASSLASATATYTPSPANTAIPTPVPPTPTPAATYVNGVRVLTSIPAGEESKFTLPIRDPSVLEEKLYVGPMQGNPGSWLVGFKTAPNITVYSPIGGTVVKPVTITGTTSVGSGLQFYKLAIDGSGDFAVFVAPISAALLKGEGTHVERGSPLFELGGARIDAVAFPGYSFFLSVEDSFGRYKPYSDSLLVGGEPSAYSPTN
jgi:hypothetical protein